MAGALLGLALGDALGFVVEAMPPKVAAAYVRDTLRGGRAGERCHPDYPFGQYSDDTQLARELLLSIVDAGGWSPARFGARIAALVLAGREVGAGPGTRSAARRFLLGAPWTHAGTPPPYAGNGSAMRVAPAGALYRTDQAAWRRCAREQSRVTHHDRRCAAGAVAIAGAAVLAAGGGQLRPGAFLEQLAGWVEEDDVGMAKALRGLTRWLRLTPAAAMQRLHESALDPAFTGGPWRGISAFVTPSVVWSLYAFLRSPDDWWETICVAIEPGGDTDTMAAMAGGIAGSRNGPVALPASLMERLTDRGAWDAAALHRLVRRCSAVVGASVGPDEPGVIVGEGTRS